MKRNVIALTAALALAACGSGEQDPPAAKTSVATAQAGDLAVELLTDSRLEVGKTPVYVRLRSAAGQVVTDAAVAVTPMMTMVGGASHGAPVLGPATVGADGLYRCEVVFQMPSGATTGSWSARVSVARPGAAPAEAVFANLVVVDAGRAKPFTDPATSTRYVISLTFENAPVVGLNPVVVTLHRMQDMMTFVPVEGASFALDPQMPSMGHGSPGSVNPTAVAPGRYEGKLSFSMAGDWETTVTVRTGDAVIGAPRFAITF